MRISTKAFVSFAFAAALITAQSNDAFAAAKRGKDRQKEITRIKKEAQRLQEKVNKLRVKERQQELARIQKEVLRIEQDVRKLAIDEGAAKQGVAQAKTGGRSDVKLAIPYTPANSSPLPPVNSQTAGSTPMYTNVTVGDALKPIVEKTGSGDSVRPATPNTAANGLSPAPVNSQTAGSTPIYTNITISDVLKPTVDLIIQTAISTATDKAIASQYGRLAGGTAGILVDLLWPNIAEAPVVERPLMISSAPLELGGSKSSGKCSIGSEAIRCIENSSPWIEFTVDIPKEHQFLSADVLWHGQGDGDIISLLLDGKPIWNMAGTNFYGDSWVNTGLVPINTDSGTHTLRFQLNGVGEHNADVALRNLRTVSTFAEPVPPTSALSSIRFVDNMNVTTAVPEPETYAMLLAGLGILGFAARRKKLQAV